MRGSFALLGVLTWYLAAPATSPRRVETFGDWSTPVKVDELNTRLQRYVRRSDEGRTNRVFSSDRLAALDWTTCGTRPGRPSTRRGKHQRTCRCSIPRSIPPLWIRSQCFPTMSM